MKAEDKLSKMMEKFENLSSPTLKMAEKLTRINEKSLIDLNSSAFQLMSKSISPSISTFADLTFPSIDAYKTSISPALSVLNEIKTSALSSFHTSVSPALTFTSGLDSQEFSAFDASVRPLDYTGLKSKSEHYFGVNLNNVLNASTSNCFNTNSYESFLGSHSEINRLNIKLDELTLQASHIDSISESLNNYSMDLDSCWESSIYDDLYLTIGESQLSLEDISAFLTRDLLISAIILQGDKDWVDSEIKKIESYFCHALKAMASCKRRVDLRKELRKNLKIIHRQNTDEERLLNF